MKRSGWFFLCAGALLLCFLGYPFLQPVTAASKISPEAVTFYRSVHVLESLSTLARQEAVDIPRAVRRDDATESLHNHPDKIFVLQQVVKDLRSVQASFAQAKLFEAYAFLALGEHRQAAELLVSYIADAPFSERHYQLACKSLKATNDTLQLYIICLEWAQRDPSCNKERQQFLWGALFQLERYSQARTVMLQDSNCADWSNQIYGARASMALGEEDVALASIDELLAKNPEQQEQIANLWEQVRNQTMF